MKCRTQAGNLEQLTDTEVEMANTDPISKVSPLYVPTRISYIHDCKHKPAQLANIINYSFLVMWPSILSAMCNNRLWPYFVVY